MKTNVHLNFKGNCTEAFDFYQKVFGGKMQTMFKYKDAPPEMQAQISPDVKDKVMHCSMTLGNILLMGCDAPEGRSTPLGGFQISVDMPEEEEVKRIYAELSEGGSVQMPLAPTFWSPLFGMCTDKFGVAWMVSVPGPQM
jgi:PhnB protein